ncbi:hypothetical protein ACQY0O_005607 [Thecaphora frezii]
MGIHKPYILIFKPLTPPSTLTTYQRQIQDAGGTIKQTFNSPVMCGFSATVPACIVEVLSKLCDEGKHEHLEYIELDSEVRSL